MTLKTSFFNKGIFMSTIKRFKIASIIYFVLLFQNVLLPVITLGLATNELYPLYLTYSVSTAIVLPAIMGILVFGFMHSKKTAIFINSMPVSRTSVYTSTVAGAFVLMTFPVLVAGIVLILLALTTHSAVLGVGSCLTWIGFNLLALFMMFSIVCFASMLTGSKWGAVAFNGLIHLSVPIIVVCLEFFAEIFLNGYMSDNAFITKIMEGNFVIWLEAMSLRFWGVYSQGFEFGKMFLYIGISVLFYVFGWLLCKKRHAETVGDMAGFKVLNPIFKYCVTFIVASVTFSIGFGGYTYNISSVIISVLVFSSLAYFGAEMMLKKTARVFTTQWIGYVAFLLVFAMIISVFAFTDFFGFEKRVPDTEDIESAAFYCPYDFGYYYDGENLPYFKDEDVIESIREVHNGLIEKDQGIRDTNYYCPIHIKYKLKDGSVIERRYYLNSERELDIIYNILAENEGMKSYIHDIR